MPNSKSTNEDILQYTIKTRRPITRSMSKHTEEEDIEPSQEALTLPKSTEPYTSTDVVDIQEKLSFSEQVPFALISEFLSLLPSRNFVNMFISFLRDSDTSVREFVATDFLNNTPKVYSAFFIAYKREHRDLYTLPDLIEKRTKVLARLTAYISTNITEIDNKEEVSGNSTYSSFEKVNMNTNLKERSKEEDKEIMDHTKNNKVYFNSIKNNDNTKIDCTNITSVLTDAKNPSSVIDTKPTPSPPNHTSFSISNISKKLESIIFSSQNFNFNNYKQKAFILLQNLKNNKELCSELLSGSIDLVQLMTMREEELANSSIRKQRSEISQQTFNERVIKKEDNYFKLKEEKEMFEEVVEKLPGNEVEGNKERRLIYRYHFSISALKSNVFPAVDIKAIEIHSELNNDIQLSELTAINHGKIRQLFESIKEVSISGSINLEKIVVYINELMNTKRKVVIPFRIANSTARVKQFLLFRKVLNESRKAGVVDLETTHGLLFYLFPYLDVDMALKHDSIVGNLYSNLINLLGIDLLFAKQEGFENDGFCICVIDPEKTGRVQKMNSCNSNKKQIVVSGNWDSSVRRDSNSGSKVESGEVNDKEKGYNEKYDGYGGYNNYENGYGNYNHSRRYSYGDGRRENKRAKVYKPMYESGDGGRSK